MKPARNLLARALEADPAKSPTDRDALRALVNGGDYLGNDADGDAWLLVRTTPAMIEWLATMDAKTDDAEDGGDGNSADEAEWLGYPMASAQTDDDEEGGDQECDECDHEPDYDDEPSANGTAV